MSHIRVSVQWKASTVFAGEELECTITFKNVSRAHCSRRSPSPSPQLLSHGSSRERWRETLPMRSAQRNLARSGHGATPAISETVQDISRIHKPVLSLSTSHGPSPAPMVSAPTSATKKPSLVNSKHRRSISIVSIGGDTIDEAPSSDPNLNSGEYRRGHHRAASLHVLPRRGLIAGSGFQPGNSRILWYSVSG